MVDKGLDRHPPRDVYCRYTRSEGRAGHGWACDGVHGPWEAHEMDYAQSKAFAGMVWVVANPNRPECCDACRSLWEMGQEWYSAIARDIVPLSDTAYQQLREAIAVFIITALYHESNAVTRDTTQRQILLRLADMFNEN